MTSGGARSLERMRSRHLTAATALLGTLALAACSGDGETASTATPANGITSAATSAATESATPSDDAFPTTPTDLPTRAEDGTVFPGDSWERARPRALGFDPKRLEAIAQQARPSRTTCLLVARKGKVVGEWNWRETDPETPREVFSVTKSITSTLVGMAQAEGDLDIDQPGQALHRGMAGHQVTRGHHPRHPQQRQRPLLGRRQRLRQPAPGRGPHPVRRRPEAAVPARPGLGLQQRRHPDPRPGGLDGDRGAHPRVRRREAVRPDRHDPHPDDGRPRRQHQRLLRNADDVSGPRSLRLPVPATGPVG